MARIYSKFVTNDINRAWISKPGDVYTTYKVLKETMEVHQNPKQIYIIVMRMKGSPCTTLFIIKIKGKVNTMSHHNKLTRIHNNAEGSFLSTT